MLGCTVMLVTILLAPKPTAAVLIQGGPVLPPTFPYELRTADPNRIEPTLGTDLYKHAVRYQGGLDWIEVLRHQRGSPNSAWISAKKKLTTAGSICAVTYRQGGNDLFVGLFKANGETAIERWQFAPRVGTYVYGIGTTVPPQGIAQPDYFSIASLTVAGDVPFSEAAASVIPEPRRTVIFEGSSIGIVRDLVVEPEGRFLLVLTYGAAPVIYRLSLTDPQAVPVQALSSVEFPAISEAEDICLWFHVTEGRKYVIREVKPFSQSPELALLPDANIDGVLESAVIMSHDMFHQAGYGVGSQWYRLFDGP